MPLDELPDPLPIEPLKTPFDVTIRPPGSKSITCRAYVLAALAKGESRIIRPLRAEDPDRLLEALCTLGAKARWKGEDVIITGVDGRFPRGGSVNLGDGGAPTRFMIAAACLAADPVFVDGSPRMRERPIAQGVDLLRQLGAKIEYIEEQGRLPVRVTPSRMHGGEIHIGRLHSSQFVSALMLIRPWLPEEVKIRGSEDATSHTYLSLTLEVLGQWGLEEERCEDGFCVPAGDFDGTFAVEPDASSALYWLFGAAISPGSKVTIEGLPRFSDQPDAWLFNMFDHCGTTMQYGESAADDVLNVQGGPVLLPPSFDGSDAPDGVLAAAAAAACASGSSHITGLHTLRVKETDRIAALAKELRRIGCTVENTDDSITIDPSTLHDEPVVIETYNDHRMAMAFAILGLARPGMSIANPACVRKSYPTFWQDFARLYE